MNKEVIEKLEEALATETKLKAKWEKSIKEGAEISSGFDYANQVRSTEKGLIRQALTLLKQQPPAGDFTKKFRELIKLSEEHLSDNKIGRLQTYGKEACARLDRAESTNKDLLAALENYVDDEPCSYDHHGYCQTHYGDPCRNQQAKAAIAKAKKEGE